ncbi:MAG: ribonuclease HII [Candidatus Bathyarchaeota archaeon]|nr:ribonuclease HII [Chloroflexota bacterium]MCL5877558.1 ribonuclease HII [Candidatus Bathyarchaeota archaeon]
MLVAGVDEAGRGCVIGPLVVAGVCVQSEKLPQLAGLGVKDSKLLTPKKREALYPEILKLVQSYHTIKVPPYIIDKAVRSKRTLYKLNRLEAQTMAKIIHELHPDEAYVDAADVRQERFGEHIKECLTTQTTIISKHKADRTYPVVSAASIIAKVERDREINALKVTYGDFGSGYLTDDETMGFLKRLLCENGGCYPSCVRKSWEPARRAKAEHGSKQRTLV